MDVIWVHEKGRVAGVQNGLAVLAGQALVAPDAPVLRAMLVGTMGPEDWGDVPRGGDVLVHYGPRPAGVPWDQPYEPLGRSDIQGVLRVAMRGGMRNWVVTIGGHEASEFEVRRIADSLGFVSVDAVLGKMRELGRLSGCPLAAGFDGVVVCW